MKKLAYIFFLLFCTHRIQAQTEAQGVSLPESYPSQMKDFGGFILDMGTMLNAESLVVPLSLPTLSYLTPLETSNPFQLNPEAFKLNPQVVYSGGTGNGMGRGMVNWQGASYKLNNGMRINMYGEYNADGYRVYNPSAMPWERNNFNAAFEFKSANGSFGIKVEVHGGRNNPY